MDHPAPVDAAPVEQEAASLTAEDEPQDEPHLAHATSLPATDAVVHEPGAASAPAQELEQASTSTSKPPETSSILKLKGLPYTTTESDIREFFKDYNVEAVRFVYEPDGRPSGLAFAQFDAREEALKALSKNGDFMGARYVRLLHVPATEMEEQVRLGTLAIPGNAAKLRGRRMAAQQLKRMPFLQPQMQLVPTVVPSALYTVPSPLAYQGGMQDATWHPFRQGTQGLHTSQFASPQQLTPAAMQQRGGGLALAGPAMHVQPPAMHSQTSGMHGQAPAMHTQRMAMHGQAMHGQAAPVLSQGPSMQGLAMHGQARVPAPPRGPRTSSKPHGEPVAQRGGASQVGQVPQGVPVRATVKVRGLPYRSTPTDILQFFQGYQYLPDSLQIGLDSLNRPSGEAWLTFVSPAEALRAVSDLNRHYLGNRYLELSLC